MDHTEEDNDYLIPETPLPPIPPGTAVPGVLMSLVVPGIGRFRSGHYLRGIFWFIVTGVACFGSLFAIAHESVPLIAGVLLLPVALGVYVWMLIDCGRPGRTPAWIWLVFSLVVGGFIAALFLIGPRSLTIARPFKIPTGGMEPTLMGYHEGGLPPDQVIVNRASYLFKDPQRGDVVVFETSDIPGIMQPGDGPKMYYVQRLVGLPGERIEIKEGSVFADGRKLGIEDGMPAEIRYSNLNSHYGGPNRGGNFSNGGYIVGDGEYFMLGDNSQNSADSRLWGNVPRAAVYGKVTKIYLPLSRRGPVK